MPGRIPLESLAGIAWNPWPESNGITGRDHVESVAGIVWNLHAHYANLLRLRYGSHFFLEDCFFQNGETHKRLLSTLSAEVGRSREPFIDHYRQKYAVKPMHG